MAVPHGVRVSREVRRGFWAGVREGLSPSEAAVAIGASDSAGRRWILNAGGVMERCPRPGRLPIVGFGPASIENGCRGGFTFTAIATLIGKSTATISREVGANGGRQRYRAELAQLGAEDRARRPKQTKLEANPVLRDRVEADLEAYVGP